MRLIYCNQSQAQKVLNFMLLTAFLSLVVSYIIGVFHGDHDAWLPTISELDRDTPEGTLWSAGLTMAGVMSIPIWITLYQKWDRQLRNSNADPIWLKCNLLFVVMSQIAAVSFIWTVNLPFNDYPVPHGVTAALYFWLTLAVGTVSILVVRKIDNYPKDLIKVRLALNLVGYACILLLGFSVRALTEDECVRSYPCKPLFMNMGLDPDHEHGIHSMVSLFEWLMVFTAQIGFFYTMNHDLKDESIIE